MNKSVLFDARLLLDKPTGVGQYISSLVPEMVRQAPDVHFHLLRRARPFPGYDVDTWNAPNLTHHISALRHMSLQQHIAVPQLARALNVSLLHYPHFDAPVFFGNIPVVATIHDAKYLVEPEFFTRLGRVKRGYMRFCFAQTLRWADAVAVDSHATAGDLARLFGTEGGKRLVIPLAADPAFRPASSAAIAAVCSRYGVARPFVLSVGELRPHKNTVGLLHAYAQSLSRLTHDLVFVGQAYQDYREPWEVATHLGLLDKVHFLTNVNLADLIGLYSGASLFVLVSFYEGFGLPILEAMACETPVLASCTTSSGEITGDGGMQVDPTDIAAVTAQIDAILKDPGLQQTLIERGRRRAADFSWQRTARATLALYEHVWQSQ